MDHRNRTHNRNKAPHNRQNRQFLEETSSELSDGTAVTDYEKDEDLKNVYGWVALALSVLSFFIVPYLFAALAIIFGFVARHRHAPILGNTAIVIAIISVLFRLFLLPLI